MADYILPLVHLNGTGRKGLFESYSSAYAKALAFRKSMCDVEFHPRDYYPMGNEAFNDAKFERNQILAQLDDIISYLEEHIIHLAE